MEWHDRGLVLSRRPYGDSGAVVSLLTAEHGRHAGLLRGARSARGIDVGARVDAVWRARLAEHLGNWRLEPVGAPAGPLLRDRLALAALVSACAVADAALPEREPHPDLFAATEALFDVIAERPPGWPAVLVRWELGLLQSLGYGLALDRCAVTGEGGAGPSGGLTHVSPRTGRAVSAAAAAPYRERLLALPRFLRLGQGPLDSAPQPAEVVQGLDLTGHFLERRLFGAGGRGIPAARAQFVTRCRRLAAGGEDSLSRPPADGPEGDI
ncbi:DNA repair protein RecO [Marinibaculum pumilum]|uniref:DNA repair protein RecO n=1 Tax=Marinibaculum pumilum TaxID=1766165 RepID=A0ABV7KW47_9PROT